jgi:arylsulfatase
MKSLSYFIALLLLDGFVRAAGKPSIVFMIVDHLGYGDIGCHDGGAIRGAPTPRPDKLASEGLRLAHFCVEPECTPSLSARLTGYMPIQSS